MWRPLQALKALVREASMPSHLVGKGKPSPLTNSFGCPSDPNFILHRYLDSSLDLFLLWRSMDSSGRFHRRHSTTTARDDHNTARPQHVTTTARHDHSTARSLHGTTKAPHAYGTAPPRHDHGTARPFHGTSTARYDHGGTARPWQGLLLLLLLFDHSMARTQHGT